MTTQTLDRRVSVAARKAQDRARRASDWLFRPYGVSEPQRSVRPALVYFGASVVFGIVYVLAVQPHLLLGGEMWAEMATNYFANASSGSWVQQLFATDAGYIPFPQRVLALVPVLLGFSSAAVPFYYSWVGVVFGSLLLAIICLPRFRALLPSDLLRFALALLLLVCLDPETRTFINFTYLAAVPVTLVAALAFVDRDQQVPRWAWVLPVLFLSKPFILTAFPFMVIAALVSRSRFRWITVVSAVMVVLQVIQLAMSRAAGLNLTGETNFSTAEKIIAAFRFSFGYLGATLIGPSRGITPDGYVAVGGVAVAVAIALVFIFRRAGGVLIIGALILLFGSFLLNTFGLPGWWNIADDTQMTYFPVVRQTIGAVFAALVLVGVAATFIAQAVVGRAGRAIVSGRPRAGRIVASAGAVAIVFLWLAASGFLPYATSVASASDRGGNSNWQHSADAIDSGQPICVPIDPVTWTYLRGCAVLASNFTSSDVFAGEQPEGIDASDAFELPVPAWTTEGDVQSVAIYVRSTGLDDEPVTAVGRTGTNVLTGATTIGPTFSLLQLSTTTPITQATIDSLAIDFSIPVVVAIVDGTGKYASSWYGF